MNVVKPNFFIVGAPKCGTTALYTYLKAHPDIFMPEFKEPYFFAPELAPPRRNQYTDLESYLSLFATTKDARRIGEASAFYLYHPPSAQQIYDFQPDARILIMLRNPVDVMYSWYFQAVNGGNEDIATFEEALAAEPDRKNGLRLPPRSNPAKLFYHDIVTYSPQVERYFSVFGREAVHVIIFDDFKADTGTVFRDTLHFLGVDPTFTTEFRVVNANKEIRFQALNRLVRRPPEWFVDDVEPVIHRVVPSKLLHGINAGIRSINRTTRPRPPLDPELRTRLNHELRPDVERLSNLLDRDLTHWCEPITTNP